MTKSHCFTEVGYSVRVSELKMMPLKRNNDIPRPGRIL